MKSNDRVLIKDFDVKLLRDDDKELYDLVRTELLRLNLSYAVVTRSVLNGDKSYRDIDVLVPVSKLKYTEEWFLYLRKTNCGVLNFIDYAKVRKKLEDLNVVGVSYEEPELYAATTVANRFNISLENSLGSSVDLCFEAISLRRS